MVVEVQAPTAALPETMEITNLAITPTSGVPAQPVCKEQRHNTIQLILPTPLA